MRRSLCLLSVGLTIVLAMPASAGQGEKSIREAVSLFQRGAIYARRGETERSREFFQRATAALPGFPEAHLGLGHIALRDKHYSGALEHYLGARDGFKNLGDKLYDLRVERYRDAREEVDRLRDVMTELDNPRLKILNRDMEKIRIEGEIRKPELVRLATPGEGLEPPGEVFFYIGNAQFHLGMLNEAVGAWEECAKKAPDFPLVHNNLAIGYLKLGRVDVAQLSLDRAEKLGVAVHPDLKRDIARASLSSGLPTTR